jgi:hypothetical protein
MLTLARQMRMDERASAAATTPRFRRFSEGQAFYGRAWAALALSGALPLGILWALPFLATTTFGRDAAFSMALRSTLALVPALLLIANFLYLRTHFDGRTLTVTFGALFPMVRRTYDAAEVVVAEPVEYNALRDFGGYGIRRPVPGGTLALTARGEWGVGVRLRNGERVLIGSQRPEELASVLRSEGRD